MKSLLQKILYTLSQAVLKKYTPDSIGITGSVGKTSTKDAIECVLQGHFRVRANAKNYNNEIGVPLTIIGVEKSPGKSLFGWLGVFLKALWLLIIRASSYPQILILEMGTDKPGDIAYLTRLAPCKIGIITAISPAHLEFFKSFEEYEDEKKEMFHHLSPTSIAVINADDPLLLKEKEGLHTQVLTYGSTVGADVSINSFKEDCAFLNGKISSGISFHVVYKSEKCLVELPFIFGRHAMSSVLPAIAVGTIYEIPLATISKSLKKYSTPKERMRLVPGMKKTFIIDDTYNSSPKAAKVALDTLQGCQIDEGARRIAVLGDMCELGVFAKKEHEEVGRYVAQKNIDMLITVGREAKDIALGAREAGLDTNSVLSFDDAPSTQKQLQDLLRKGDVILVKGSQAVRLEKIVEAIMEEPDKVQELLVRQEKEWK